jgi:hypothetical protein
MISCGRGTRYATKKFEKAKRLAPFDVIIVPGSPYHDSSRLGQVLIARIHWAKYLYDQGIAKNIIFSGSAVYTPYFEGLAMKLIADSLGIPKDHTFAETKAQHSTENVWYSAKMAKTLGFSKIALATDHIQTKLLKSFVKGRMQNMACIPIVYDMIDPQRLRNLTLPTINDTLAYDPKFVSILERETFWERLKGTRGKHINYNE